MYIWNYLFYKADLNSNKHSQIITNGIYIHIHTIKYLNLITWPFGLEYKDSTICEGFAYISSLYTLTLLNLNQNIVVN